MSEWKPITVDVHPDPNFSPIYVGEITETAAPVAAPTKPATGKKED